MYFYIANRWLSTKQGFDFGRERFIVAVQVLSLKPEEGKTRNAAV